MWWWLYVVVEAVHGGDGHLCVAVHGGMIVYVHGGCAWWLWSIMNEHATATINMKGCTLMIDCRGTRAKEEKEEKKERGKRKKKKKKVSTEGFEPVIFCL